MANFNVHLSGGALVSGMAASALVYTGLFSPLQGAVLWGAGTLGGLLPDIDADASTPLNWIFSLLAVIAALFTVRLVAGQSLVMIWGAMLCVFLAIRFGVQTLFTRITRHRGAWHSCLAGVFSGLGAAWISHRWMGQAAEFSWAIGGVTLLGFFTHLILDELYSVNLSGVRIKKSFGTALKPFSLNAWWASLMLAAASLWLWDKLPHPGDLVSEVAKLFHDKANWQFVWLSCR